MLKTVTLKNFRCFKDHTIELENKTLIVGKNNAGKSTCIEGLRLVSLVTERLGSLHLHPPPSWTDLPRRAAGVSPSLESIEIHGSSLFHNYGEPPAVVSAKFDHGSSVDVHIGPDLALHAVIYDQDGEPANKRSSITAARIPRVSILPQISPLIETELVLEDSYVRQNIQTSLSSRHFRNQLRIFREHFKDFQLNVSATWPGVAIQQLAIPPITEQKSIPIQLLVRDNDFTAEAAWMGHGLQMWLQTIWFLARNAASSVLILDEPDVYMHADLQRKLVRMLTRDNRQFIIATHSPEMLAEVEPDSVVILDRKRRISRAATSSRAVQELLLRVGSVHNLSLARLASQRRLVLVEGKDVLLLKRLQNAFDPGAERPIDTVPHVNLGGWNGWSGALTLARFFEKNVPDEIKIHCILDRDYHTDEEIAEREKDAADVGINLTVWSAKELENYLIVPAALARLISKRIGKSVSTLVVEDALDAIVEGMRDDARGSMIDSYRARNPAAGTKPAIKPAETVFNRRWEESKGRLVVCGKDVLSQISAWAQSEYKVSVSIPALIQNLSAGEVHREVREVISSVTTIR
ncbi:MAG: AAA family ATPase [Verrucomicrobiales bacterium]|nr:AAA family ATPase [Verrucomicrobiales bacterium]